MSRKSSGVGDLARLSTTSHQIEETEIRATLLSDSFGAEGSFAQSFDSIDAPVKASTSELILHCPSCHAETFVGDRFCQECGSLQPAFEESKGSLSPEVFKQLVVSNSKALLASLALSVSVVLLLAGVFSILRMSDDLEKALVANRLNEAVALSERLMVSHFGVLSGRDAELYSSAFFKRAQVFAKNGNFKRAVFDISRVLPNCTKSVEAAQLKAAYVSQVGHLAPRLTGERATAGGASPLGGTTSVAEPPAIPGSTSARGLRNISASPVAPSLATAYSPKDSGSVYSSTSAKNSSAKDLSQEPQAAASEGTNLDSEEVNSEEADMAAYNRHLAEYFSKKNTNSPAKDPPSFGEWVQSGKTEF